MGRNKQSEEEKDIKELAKSHKLNERHEMVCYEYLIDFNKTRAYKAVYKDCTDDSARAGAARLFANVNVQAFIKEIQKDLAKLAGVSILRNVLELKKIAYSSISHLHDTWLERKEFEELTEDQKAMIESIETRVEKRTIKGVDIEKKTFKIKLYPKLQAIEIMNKMLGWNAPEKIEVKNVDLTPEERKAKLKELREKFNKTKE